MSRNLHKARRQQVSESLRPKPSQPAREILAHTPKGRQEANQHLVNIVMVIVGLAFIFYLRSQELEDPSIKPLEPLHCEFTKLVSERLARKGFQSNFVERRRPLLVTSLPAEEQLAEFLDHFQNHTSPGANPISSLSVSLEKEYLAFVTTSLSLRTAVHGDLFLSALDNPITVTLTSSQPYASGRCHVSHNEGLYIPGHIRGRQVEVDVAGDF